MRMWARFSFWQGLLFGALAIGQTQTNAPTTVLMDYGVYLADCEIDDDRDGVAEPLSVYGTWGDQAASLQASGATLSLDSARKFSGQHSQRVAINRTSGTPGTLTLRFDPINDSRYIQPPAGVPVLVRVMIRAEGFQNATYRVRARTGDRWMTLLSDTSADSGGWQAVSGIVPLETDSNGQPLLRLYWEISLGDGAARGTLWVDGLQVLAQPITVPQRTRPNAIKMAQYVSGPRDWAEFTEVPLTFALASRRDIVAIRKMYPQLTTLLYLHANKAYARPDRWSSDLYDYYDVDQNHPEWFLLDSNGNRIQDLRYPDQNSFYIDPGHPQAQNRAAERLVLLTQGMGVVSDWIYLDGWNGRIDSQQYPTWESILPAWLSLAQRLSPVVRNTLGAKLMVNSASQMGLYVDGNIGTQWMPYIDGVLHEGAWTIYNSSQGQYSYRAYNSTRTPVNFKDSSWVTVLRAVNSYPDKYWIMLVQCDPNDRDMFRYAVASYLIVQHDRCILAFDDRATMGPHTFLTFNLRNELFVPLGQATGDYQILQGTLQNGALFARNYEYGMVLVNPTVNQTFQYTTTRAYKDWDGNLVPANTTLTIASCKGVVLYAAPEVSIEITPPQTSVLPGQTLTFTVRYRNTGLVDATNVQIAVPLMDGMSFMGGSDGATYHNRQVRWNVPRIRPGESGTRTFTVQVQ